MSSPAPTLTSPATISSKKSPAFVDAVSFNPSSLNSSLFGRSSTISSNFFLSNFSPESSTPASNHDWYLLISLAYFFSSFSFLEFAFVALSTTFCFSAILVLIARLSSTPPSVTSSIFCASLESAFLTTSSMVRALTSFSFIAKGIDTLEKLGDEAWSKLYNSLPFSPLKYSPPL